MLPENGLFRRRALFSALSALVIVFVVWNIPQLDFALYPFRLFVTFVHEAGHGLAALATGGRFLSFQVDASGAGLATTAGGNRAIILPAGYLGAALFGAGLFYIANTLPRSRGISVLLGAALIGIAIWWGGIFSLATLVGVLMGVALITMGLKASRGVNLVVLNVLALITGLHAVLDLLFLVNNSHVQHNDALAFSRTIAPILPAAVWAFVWALIAVGILLTSVYYALIRPWRRSD
jgi:hypothetical protein